jgi:hypothetical protein
MARLGDLAAHTIELENAGINQGDINLGSIAASWGSQVADGTLKPGQLGNKIRDNLCKH